MIIGADIGGSHITCALVDLESKKIVPESFTSIKVDSKAPKEMILGKWAEALNAAIATQKGSVDEVSIGFAMPGPFDYQTGTAKFTGNNEKFQNLYGVSITNELPFYITTKKCGFRFLNDAAAFGAGLATLAGIDSFDRSLILTFGTGLGASFLKRGVPCLKGDTIPKDGCLWDKSFRSGIGDAYFSTRWFVNRYEELTNEKVNGVKEIVQKNGDAMELIFTEFSQNLIDFLKPYITKFEPQVIVMGGNISKAGDFFLPKCSKLLEQLGMKVDIKVSEIGEEAAVLGSAQLFDSAFWKQLNAYQL